MIVDENECCNVMAFHHSFLAGLLRFIRPIFQRRSDIISFGYRRVAANLMCLIMLFQHLKR
jgi:hypothetical protein